MNRPELSAMRALAPRGRFLMRPRDTSIRPGVFGAGSARVLLKVGRKTVADLVSRGCLDLSSRSDRIDRFIISDAGRAALARAEVEDNPSDTVPRHRRAHMLEAERLFQTDPQAKPEPIKVNLGESPVGWLASRPGPDGKPFLNADEAQAAETLRADFERAQLAPSITLDWRKFASGPRAGGGQGQIPMSAEEARLRLHRALTALGPELADAALRMCCFLDGIEAVERDMGWSQRSGKVVLRIALRRLVDHYRIAPRQQPSSAAHSAHP